MVMGKISVGYNTEPCLIRLNDSWVEAEFFGVFQNAGVDLLFQQPYASTIAVVRYNGKLLEMKFINVSFDFEEETND